MPRPGRRRPDVDPTLLPTAPPTPPAPPPRRCRLLPRGGCLPVGMVVAFILACVLINILLFARRP